MVALASWAADRCIQSRFNEWWKGNFFIGVSDSDDFGAPDIDQLAGGSGSDLFELEIENIEYDEDIGFAENLNFQSGIDTVRLNGP